MTSLLVNLFKEPQTTSSTGTSLQDSTSKVEQIASFVFSSICSIPLALYTKGTYAMTLLRENTWTPTEVSRLCLRLLAVYAFIGGIFMTGTSFSSFWSSSSLFLFASGLAHYSYALIDYENPKELQASRDSAKKLPFSTVLAMHTWPNLVQHQILSPTEFYISCKRYMEGLSFSAIVLFHQKLQESYISFPVLEYLDKIPHPSLWKEKFKTEYEAMSFAQILEKYSVEQLKEWQILPEETLCRLEQTSHLLTQLASLDKERKRVAIMHLEKLLKEMKQDLMHKQHLLSEWLNLDRVPLVHTITETFPAKELAELIAALNPLDTQLLKVEEELKALRSVP